MDAIKNIKLFAEEEEQVRDQVLLLPGYLFFTEAVDIPKDIGADDLRSLAELTLESLTPFPLEQLVWGYAWDRPAGTLLVYAAFRERLRKEGHPEIEAYRQVYPDFLALHNTGGKAPRLQVLIQPNSVTLAAFPAGARVPADVLGAPLADDDDPQAVVGALAEEMDEAAYPLGETLDRPLRAEAPHQGPIRFFAGGEGEAREELVELPDELTWPADLRSTDFCKREQTVRRRDRLLWRGMLAAAGIVVLLLGLEGLRFAGNLWLDTRRARIEDQSTTVARIQSRSTLVSRLEQRATSQLEPFQALRLMNRNRPPTIYFTATEAEVPNRMVIEGVARTVNEVNSYTTALANTGYFQKVDPRNVRSQAGQVTFTLELTLGELPATTTEVAEVTP